MSTKKNTKKTIKIEVTKKTKSSKKQTKAPANKKKVVKETIELSAPEEFLDMLNVKAPDKKKAKKAPAKKTKKPASKKPAVKKTSKKEDNVTQLPPASGTVYDNSGKEPYKKPELAAKGNGYDSCSSNKPTGCCCGQPTNASDLTKEAVDAGNFIIKLIRKLFGK